MLSPKFLGCIVASVLLTGILYIQWDFGVVRWPLTAPPTHQHPILLLHQQALKSHEEFLSRQSQTYEDAVLAYRSRYRLDPPVGFEAWFRKAQEMRSAVIDDFDTPFLQLEPYRLHPLVKSSPVEALARQRLLRLCFEGRKLSLEGFRESWFVDALHSLVDPFLESVPDLCLYMNTLDEPRSIPLPYGESATQDAVDSQNTGGVSFFSSADHHTIFTEATLPCLLAEHPVDHPTVLSSILHGHQHYESNFADDFDELTDLCNYNRTLAHGLVSGPESFSFTHDPVAILSNAKLSTFGDVLFPSLWRFEHSFPGDGDDTDDREWSQKSNTLYWRGSTTGGHGAASGSWEHMHRQGLITQLHSLPLPPGAVQPDVAFTGVIQCDDAACQAQKERLPMDERRPLTDAWRARFLLDVDGNGLSGRLYELMRSNGVVLRHTMLREWHDERLRPWLHYIPLKPGAPEMPELLDYLATEEGDRIAQTIAQESRRWAEATLRQEDMMLYFWRLLLEAGRKPGSDTLSEET